MTKKNFKRIIKENKINTFDGIKRICNKNNININVDAYWSMFFETICDITIKCVDGEIFCQCVNGHLETIFG